MTNRSSLTAEYMALFRALESRRPANQRLFSDPDARLFLTGTRKWLLRLSGLPAGRRLTEFLLDRASPGARAAGIARTKWIDSEVAGALNTVTQLVLLGAGFDMRAFRLAGAERLTTFELDHPETSRAKSRLLQKTKTAALARVRYVPIDFNRQRLAEVLLAAGFDGSQPACFLWEGVTNYLTGEAVDGSLRQISAIGAKGSILIFTYIERQILENPQAYYGGQSLLARVNSYGEPWTFGLDPNELSEYLKERGFELLMDLSGAEVWRREGRPASEVRGYEFYRIARARIV